MILPRLTKFLFLPEEEKVFFSCGRKRNETEERTFYGCINCH